jgi:cytoskeletal protein CcmA (bactofilin family)
MEEWKANKSQNSINQLLEGDPKLMKYRDENIGKDEVTIIGAGVILEGKITCKGNIRVDGVVNGDINANGSVAVGENGEINGEINAEVINVGGKVTGSLNAKDKLVLEAKAVLKGDVITKILVVEAGANFDGNSKMANSKEAPKLTSTPSSPAPTSQSKT